MKRQLVHILGVVLTILPHFVTGQRLEPLLDIYAVNHFAFDPDGDTRKQGARMLGVGLGFQWDWKSEWDIGIHGALNLARPRAANRPDNGEFEAFGSSHASVVFRHEGERFTWGAGPVLSRHIWVYGRTGVADSIPPTRPLLTTATWTMGLQLESAFWINERFSAALIWRPTYFRFSNRNTWAGEHVLSVGLRYFWKRAVAGN